MNELMANNEQTMTSIDLYNLVCVSRVQNGETQPRLNDFHARVVDELDGEHYEIFVVHNSNKTTTTCYHLTIDQCLLIGMRESKSVRRYIRDKLRELELKQSPSFQIPQTLGDALQLAADQAKQLELQAPKVEYFDKVLGSSNGFTTTEIASELSMSAVAMNRQLAAMKVKRKIGRRWVLCADLLGNGYTTERTYLDDGGTSRHSMLWTEKGRKFILDLFK